MRNRQHAICGFSLVEMQVSIVIASILVLTIGAVAGVSTRAHNKLRMEQQIYNDISYGFKLMQNRVRECTGVVLTENFGVKWPSGRLLVGNQAFGIYSPPGWPSADFVYLVDKNNEADRETIFSVPNSTENSMNMTLGSSPASVILSGSKEDIAFNIKTNISRRLP